MKKLLTGFALVLIATWTSFAGMTSSLTFEGNYGVEVAAFATDSTGSPTGSLMLSTIPAGATMVSATLYGHNWASATRSATFTSTPLGTGSGFASDTTSGVPGLLEAYKWDVMSQVTGNVHLQEE